MFFCFWVIFIYLFQSNFPAVWLLSTWWGNAVIKDQKWITRSLHAVSLRPVCATGWCTADNNPLAAKWGTWRCAAPLSKKKRRKKTKHKITKTKQAVSRCNYFWYLCDKQPLFRRQQWGLRCLRGWMSCIWSCSEEIGAKWGAAVGTHTAAGGHYNWMHWTVFAHSDCDVKK